VNEKIRCSLLLFLDSCSSHHIKDLILFILSIQPTSRSRSIQDQDHFKIKINSRSIQDQGFSLLLFLDSCSSHHITRSDPVHPLHSTNIKINSRSRSIQDQDQFKIKGFVSFFFLIHVHLTTSQDLILFILSIQPTSRPIQDQENEKRMKRE